MYGSFLSQSTAVLFAGLYVLFCQQTVGFLCRDVSTGSTVSTPAAPKFLSTTTLFQT